MPKRVIAYAKINSRPWHRFPPRKTFMKEESPRNPAPNTKKTIELDIINIIQESAMFSLRNSDSIDRGPLAKAMGR